jgi:DNA-binding IclR family transcriptional regulator
MTKVLEMLIDGKWHTLKEIQRKTKLDKNQIQQATKFLERYGFISVDKMARKVMLDETVQKFLSQESTS